jgi:outer membrane immunogenic protein
MLRRILLTATSAVALTAAANAADIYSGGSYKDGYVPVYSWTGFYLGVGAGPASNHVAFDDVSPSSTIKGTFDTSHAFGGGQAGYNFQSGRLVYGIEADVGGIDVSGSKNPLGNDQYGTTSGVYADVTGRLGVALDRTLLYAKGGVAFLDFQGSSLFTGTFFNKSETLTGWTVGGGIEFMLFPSWSIKAEYLHFDFGNSTAFADGGSYKVHFDPAVDSVKFGINYHVHSAYVPLK